jgi:hypothetical protein
MRNIMTTEIVVRRCRKRAAPKSLGAKPNKTVLLADVNIRPTHSSLISISYVVFFDTAYMS